MNKQHLAVFERLWNSAEKSPGQNNMKISKRALLLLVLLILFFLLGILFRDFLQENFITPVALVALWFWRILLSIDQIMYWGVLLMATVMFVLSHINPQPLSIENDQPPDQNASLEIVDRWRLSILATCDACDKPNFLTRNIRNMLPALFAEREPDAAKYEIDAALEAGHIPLPKPVYAFLYQNAVSGSRSIKNNLRTLGKRPFHWYWHWTGRDVIEYYQSIQVALDYLETTMEIKQDDELANTNPS
jgi:hypothetical protein